MAAIVACPEVQSFGRLMQRQLDRNSYKGRWTDPGVNRDVLQIGEARSRANYFFDLLRHKLSLIELKASRNLDDIADLADVANYCMMIADLRWDLVQQFKIDSRKPYDVDLIDTAEELERLSHPTPLELPRVIRTSTSVVEIQ